MYNTELQTLEENIEGNLWDLGQEKKNLKTPKAWSM